jgi:hypothetical protein
VVISFGLEQDIHAITTALRIFSIAHSNAAFLDNVRHPLHFYITHTFGFAAAILVLDRQSVSQCVALCGARSGYSENMKASLL